MPVTNAPAQRELDLVRAALENNSLHDAQTLQSLTRLKMIARDPANASCIYCPQGLAILAQIAFDQDDKQGQLEATSLEAARILANALLLQDQTRQMLADLDYTSRLISFYSRRDADHEFIGGRILFLLTYTTNLDFGELVEKQHLADHVSAHLDGHVSSIATGTFGTNPLLMMALTETLKLLYNVVNKCQARNNHFAKLVSLLINITNNISIPTRPLDLPISQLLNALGIIDWPSSLTTSDEGSEHLTLLARRLVDIIDKSMTLLPPAELGIALVAPLTVLRKIVLVSHEETNQLLRGVLLPQDEERDKPLGRSQNLASRLLQLQSAEGVTVAPEAISGLLFDLSDRDASKFIQNIGYGHAAGYLMTHQIPVPENLVTQAGKDGTDSINPITGQRLDAEPSVPLPDMSDEEKEREAQKLFVLFERLKANGVVSVENPMRAAQQSGRFEELSDDEPD